MRGRRFGIAVAASVATIFAIATSAHAAVIVADADTYVRGGEFSGAAHGNDDIVRVERDPTYGRRFRAGVIRFDLSAFTAGSLADATLNLTQASDGAQQVRVFGVADGLDGWDEALLSLTQATSLLGGTAFTDLGTVDLAAGGYGATLSLTGTALLDFLNAPNGDGLVSFVLLSTQPTNGSSARFASRENGSFAGPSLDVAVASPVPVPPAAVLFGSVLLATRLKRNVSST